VFLLGVGTLLFLAVYWTLLPEAWRRPAFGIVSIAALAAYFPTAVGAIGLVAVLVHLVLSPVGETPSWGRALAAAAVCVALLAARGSETMTALRLIGLSYAVFRLIHVAFERARGKIRVEGLGAFLEYVLFPPAFLSGPIERYGDFRQGIDVSGLDLDAAFWGTRRILFGLAKKVFLVGALSAAAERGFADPSGGAGGAWLALLCYSLYVYLDFSAYCDLALGVARLFGYRLSENFRWPYLSADIGEFWRRWHITLSFWLRDYLYLPLSVKLAEFPMLRRRPLLVGSTSAIVTMLACGLWHGNTPSLAIWGLGHGVLLAGHQVYRQRILGSLPARRRKALIANPAYRVAATAITFLCVSLLWVFFRFPLDEASRLLARLFLARRPT
jgi:alginate O-acetyltransferase complex protein AlgI